LKIGILTRNENAWCSSRLKESLLKRNVESVCFSFSSLTARVNLNPAVSFRNIDLLKDLEAVIVRPIGRGSLDEIIFRMDMLHKLARTGLPVVNHPSAIEKAIDKYYTLTLLAEKGVPVPKTVVTENVAEALKAFRNLGGNVVAKPIFGSRGLGVARISNADVAERVFRTLRFYRHVIYIQEYVRHGTRDLRLLVVGDRVVAGMLRVSSSWKTNVSRGATPVAVKVESEMEKLAVISAKTIGCEIAGVDMMESDRGLLVNEINSQPGWRGLQSTTTVNIADEIVDYLLKKIKR
jgi:RimK family alpha-L-glutamate ligase